MRVLNLYSGLGGNRKLWNDCEITAVELNPRIAAVYQRLFPNDVVVVGDAHSYLLDHFEEFDFIWSSPPCQSHSRMMKATRHKSCRKYIDTSLWQEIVFLREFFDGNWVVENVVPYYEPLVKPTLRVGRHLFWSNFMFLVSDEPAPSDFINRCDLKGKQALMDWLDIHYEENIYYEGNHCPAQILRNCVHPNIGGQIFSFATTLNP